MKGLKLNERIVSFTYERDGKTYTATRATKKQIQEWHRAGLLNSLDGTCTCGSADFCDEINHVRVRCFEDSDGVCNWHSTDDVC